MKKEGVFYQIKGFDKTVLRYFLSNTKCDMKYTLTPTQMNILDYIVTHKDEEIYQKDLENVLGLRRATVSGVLKTMEKNKLIERIITSNDARMKQIVLNSSAKKIFEENNNKLRNMEQIALHNIKKQELNTFLKVLKQMETNLHDSMKEVALKKGEDDI